MAEQGKRSQNEAKFGSWEELSDVGRRYCLEVLGHHGWTARYIKEVDATEQTIRFYQAIYDDQKRLVELHEKYPDDKGHMRIEGNR
jgi:hypothetical protein